jgi:phosphoribosylaminoimidazole-succinocarboxamide synthase
MNTLLETHFKLPKQTAFYKGKVRDVYTVNNELLVMVVSDRISAFDKVLPKGIPYKGQILNQIAAKFLDATSDIVPNWKLAAPDPNVTIGIMAKPFAVEMVIRACLSGSAWRAYKAGDRVISGVNVPDGMIEHQMFEKPIITPSTKAAEGHDINISKAEIIEQGLVSAQDYAVIETYTHKLFERGSQMASKQGLILVDTKYEFGKNGDKIYLIDEIHTPDSSRYFIADGYQERLNSGEPQKQLSKEFVREWLMEHNFMGLDGQKIPFMPDEFVAQVSERYIELFEKITGEKFVPADVDNISQRVENNIITFLK